MALELVTIPTASLWNRTDVPDTDAIAVDLPDDDLAELESAARRLAANGVDPVDAGPDDLPLGPLAPLVAEVRTEVLDGRGIALLRGFPVQRCTVDEVALMFWGIGLRLGRAVSQSVMGERLGHVINVTDTDPHARAYRNRSELSPHSAPGDLLSFLCIRPAMTGGVRRFVSSLSVFSECNGLVSGRYVREYVRIAADEDPSIVLTNTDNEAISLLETTANQPDLALDFTMAAGEAVVANNFTVFHARTAFTDDPDRRRHLLRLWLAADPPRPVVPETMQYPGEPGIPPQWGRTPSFASRFDSQ